MSERLAQFKSHRELTRMRREQQAALEAEQLKASRAERERIIGFLSNSMVMLALADYPGSQQVQVFTPFSPLEAALLRRRDRNEMIPAIHTRYNSKQYLYLSQTAIGYEVELDRDATGQVVDKRSQPHNILLTSGRYVTSRPEINGMNLYEVATGNTTEPITDYFDRQGVIAAFSSSLTTLENADINVLRRSELEIGHTMTDHLTAVFDR